MNYSVGHLNWDDYPPFSRIGEPYQLDDGVNVADILELFERQRAGRSSSPTEYDREWVLNMVETRAEVERFFAGFPSYEPALPRIHDFMITRSHTPARCLEPAEAVQLAARHMARVFENIERFRSNSPQMDDDHLSEAVKDYFMWLRHLDIRWVDKTTATPLVVEFDRVPSRSSRAARELESTVEEFAPGGVVAVARSALGPDAQSSDVAQLSRLTDFGYTSLIDFVLAPIADRFDGEPYYRLWEGGASLWIGKDTLEVRTDWARRWPNARYLG